jgi:lysophospholipase L1-like esterase
MIPLRDTELLTPVSREPRARRPRGETVRGIAVWVLLVLLVLSLALNAYLVHAAVDYYKAAAAVRLDPAGLGVYAADRAKPAAGRPLLVFFGDSRALTWPEPTANTGYQTVNRGIGFQTTAQMLMRIDVDVVQLHPTVVVVEGGVNDLKTIASVPERHAAIVADCEANLAHIVDRCRQEGATVVLVTVFGIGDVSLWRKPFWSNEVAIAVREVNTFLRTLAGERVVLFDADPVLADERGTIQPSYQSDHLHLSSAGYAALNRKLVPFLSALPR